MAEAGTVTISWLPLTKVVFAVCAVPFQFTTALAPKLVPLTVRVNAAPPAVALLGESCRDGGHGPGDRRGHFGAVAARDGEGDQCHEQRCEVSVV